MRVSQRLLAAVLVALLAAIGAVLAFGRSTAGNGGPAAAGPPSASHGEFLGPTLPPHLRAADFTLSDTNARAVRLSQYRGRVVVLTFIHSLCKDACPFMVEQIKGALDDHPGAPPVPALGVSVAPAEDTVRNRLAFLRKHELLGRMAFLSGSTETLRSVWHHYAIQPVNGPIDHSVFVLLIDRRGYERVGIPADQLTPEELAHDIRALERESA